MARAKKEENVIIKDFDIDKNKLINDIKREVKNGLEEDIEDIIEIKAKDKLDGMEKRIYKYKNRTIRKRNIIIIILLIIIGLETKVLYDNDIIVKHLNKDNNIISSTQDNDKEETKDLEWYIDNYGYLLDMVNTNLDSDNFNYLYNNNYTSDNIDNKVKLNMAYQLISSNISNNNGVIIVSNDKLKDSYNKLFNDNNYSIDNFNDSCINFIYNKNNDNYMAIEVDCDNNKSIKKEIINIYEEDSNIVIDAIVGIYDSKESILSNIDGNVIKNNYNNEDLSKYKDNLNKYRYTFINNNDNYYFNSISKIK